MSGSEATVIQLSRPDVYINSLSFGGADAVAAALSSNFIHIVDLESKKSKKTLDVANNLVGVYFDPTGTAVLRAFDDSFGVHVFDIRSGSKKKSRLNPPVESHGVTCAAVSEHYMAIGTRTVLSDAEIEKRKEKKEKKKKAKKGGDDSSDDGDDDEDYEDEVEVTDQYDAIAVYDIRGSQDPVLSIKDSHSDTVQSLAFMRDGKHLISGGADGLINIFNTTQRKEDDALQSTIPADTPVSKVGYVSKRLLFGITDDNQCIAMSPNSPDDVDTLFKRRATPDRFVVDMLKGSTEEWPIALLECDTEGKSYLLSVSADGKKSEIIEEWSGHSDIIRSTAFNGGVLVTGGEDGKIVVKTLDLRSSAGKAKKEKKEKKKSAGAPY